VTPEVLVGGPITPEALADAAYAFGLWTGWGVLHSVLATRRVKAAVELVAGPLRFPLYPLGYTVISLWTFYLVVQKEPDLPQMLWFVQGAASYALYAVQAAGLGLLAWAAFTVDGLAFLGLRQLVQLLRGHPPQAADPERDFRTTGAYGFVRHPMHLGGILFLTCQPHMTLQALVFAVFGCLYIVLGSLLEERRMAWALGERWEAYCRRVPMFIPWPSP
jgi:protein-S-isoprenylcysteine O-methyltransferase Ste14